jgi:hypothetical protein
MKNLLFIPVIAVALFSCKKESSNLEPTPTLDVEKKNMGVYAVRTATWCGPCGGSLNNTQTVFENVKDVAVAMAFKDAFSEAQAPFGNFLFDEIDPMFEVGNSVPTTFQNFNATFPASINEHVDTTVTLNGNYEIEFNGTEMTINTTTKFFKEYVGDVYLAPYIIVDSLVGYQNEHPDSPETVHMKYVADIAYPSSRDEEAKYEWGYLVSSSLVKDGHKVNLQFKAEKREHWQNHNISIGMIYFKKVGAKFVFLNAFTK